jgi:hypothetical protein
MGEVASTIPGQVLALRLEVESGPVAKVILNGIIALLLVVFTVAIASVARDKHAGGGNGWIAPAAVSALVGLVGAFMVLRTLRELVLGVRVPMPTVEVSSKAPAKGPLEVFVSQPPLDGARMEVRLVARETVTKTRRTATRTEGTRYEESWRDVIELGSVAATPGQPLELRARADATRFPPPEKHGSDELVWVVHVRVDAPLTPVSEREFVIPFDQ